MTTAQSTQFEQDLLVSELLRFVEREVVSLEEQNSARFSDPWQEYERDGRVATWLLDLSREVRRASAAAGFYCTPVSVDLGGEGVGPTSMFILWEALFRRFGPGRPLPYQVMAHFATGPSAALAQLQNEPRKNVLPQLLSGEATLCFALSEPDAGSDALAIKSEARRVGSDWSITGTKQWITNGAHADYALVFVVTDKERARQRNGGITAFLVDTDTPGFQVDSVIRLYGHVGGHEAILHFEDVRVPEERVVGELNEGLRIALAAISDGRVYNCARAVGLARWALESATEYAKNRMAFGHPISDYQAIQWHLAESAMEIYAAKCMSLDCTQKLESGRRARKELAMAKAFATEAACRSIDRCMQVLGGMGLTRDAKFFDAWEQVRVVRIAEGSGEIMRRTIAKELLSGDYDF
jgi:acyl-CoA dehydrogenase